MWRPSSCLATTFTILTAFCLGFLPAVHVHSADFSSPPTLLLLLLLNLKTLNEFNVFCIIDSNFNFNASSSCLWTPAMGLWHLLSPTPTFLQLQLQMDGTRNLFSLQTVPPKWARTTHPSMAVYSNMCLEESERCVLVKLKCKSTASGCSTSSRLPFWLGQQVNNLIL